MPSKGALMVAKSNLAFTRSTLSWAFASLALESFTSSSETAFCSANFMVLFNSTCARSLSASPTRSLALRMGDVISNIRSPAFTAWPSLIGIGARNPSTGART